MMNVYAAGAVGQSYGLAMLVMLPESGAAAVAAPYVQAAGDPRNARARNAPLRDHRVAYRGRNAPLRARGGQYRSRGGI